jgi:L-fuconolactonase
MRIAAGNATITTDHPTTIDAHHHLWHFKSEEFGWIDDSMSCLRRDFLPEDLSRELAAAGIDAAIAVQARCSLLETDFLLGCAKDSNNIIGVVGWAPLGFSGVGAILDRLLSDPKFVGVREITQGLPSGYFDDAAFNAGVRELTARNLSYDILIYPSQLEEVVQFVDRHPDQRFILDHAAKPPIIAQKLEPWRTQILTLAQYPNVSCKLSGLVTEANWRSWNALSLRPYLDVCVDAFTPNRLLAGSDWPVCLAASTYARWWETLREYFERFTSQERSSVFGHNALESTNLTNGP